jgi:hypothetical protein
MNSGVASALVSAAGPNLLSELQQKSSGRIPYGTIAVTKGHNLKCAEVFHGAILQWYSKSTTAAKQPDIVCILSLCNLEIIGRLTCICVLKLILIYNIYRSWKNLSINV